MFTSLICVPKVKQCNSATFLKCSFHVSFGRSPRAQFNRLAKILTKKVFLKRTYLIGPQIPYWKLIVRLKSKQYFRSRNKCIEERFSSPPLWIYSILDMLLSRVAVIRAPFNFHFKRRISWRFPGDWIWRFPPHFEFYKETSNFNLLPSLSG